MFDRNLYTNWIGAVAMAYVTLCPFALDAGPENSGPEGAFLSRMDDLGDTNLWYRAEFARKQPSFRTAWKRSSITRNADGSVALSLIPAPEEAEKDFFGAEVQRTRRTHFGRYEVVMKAAKGNGVISSFFTYTGPYFGDAHDEIDFEFLGKDTTKVWLNRFVDGQKLPGRLVDLGFDAADAPHLYTLDWLPDRIVWSIDGREFLTVTSAETAIPQIPQRIYLNIWGGAEGQKYWSGVAPDDTRTAAHYYCVSYRPLGAKDAMCSDIPMSEFTNP